MSKIESATQWMINLANDDSHGYDQTNRWGPNYDCSSAVISAWQQAGVPVKTNGASNTRDMKSVFLNCGFSEIVSKVTLSSGAGLKRGDVLLTPGSHTAMFIGSGQIVHASQNEFGGISGGQSGDQNGREILVASYYNKPWTSVLRYTAEESSTPAGKPIVQAGQILANSFCGANIATDGVYGAASKKAGIMCVQKALNLDYKANITVDGIWGKASHAAFGQHLVMKGNTQYLVTALEILFLLRGYKPGVPGTFGDGLDSVLRTYRSEHGWQLNGKADQGIFYTLMGEKASDYN